MLLNIKEQCTKYLRYQFVKPSFVIFGFLCAFFAIIVYSIELHKDGWGNKDIAWFSSGSFVFLSCLICARLINFHLKFWTKPKVQLYIVKIIMMIPIYGIESWLALRWKIYAIYIGIYQSIHLYILLSIHRSITQYVTIYLFI
jgi:hypothetical protein